MCKGGITTKDTKGTKEKSPVGNREGTRIDANIGRG